MDSAPGLQFPIRLYTWIGVTSVNWGQVEFGLDSFVMAAFRTDRLGERRAPASLSVKIRFLRRCFSDHPSFIPYAPAGLAILDEVQRLKEKRHDLIHGLVIGVNGAGGIGFLRTRYGDEHDFQQPTYSIKQIVQLNREIRALADSMVPMVYSLLGTSEEETRAAMISANSL